MTEPQSAPDDPGETIRIFVSSPSDVAQERVIAERVAERLQGEFARRADLEVIRWEREPMRATEHFQEQITPPAETDIALFILWSRLGTPLPEEKFQKESGEPYRSGTEWEFENAVQGYREEGTPDLLTYRKTKDPEATLSDEEDVQRRLDQKRALESFIDRWFKGEEGESFRAAFHTFEEPADFERMLERHLRKLVEKHLPERPTEPGLPGPAVQAEWHQGSPFRGLRPFEEEHAPIFFGRTGEVTGIIQRLERQAQEGRPFVLVHGPSGSGKSSVLKAGVAPTLTRPGVIEGIGLWREVAFRPSDAARGPAGGQGDSPESGPASGPVGGDGEGFEGATTGDPTGSLTTGLMEAIFRALPELERTGFTPEDLAGMIQEAPSQAAAPLRAGLREAAEAEAEEKGLPEPPEARLLLAVDQLEEIFTVDAASQKERADFAAALRGLVESGLVWTVATLRSDFFPRLSEVRDLQALKQGAGNYDLDPPSFAELGLMIRGPVRAAGLRFERNPDRGIGLDEVLHEAAAEAPEALPLLEFTLEELYRRRSEEDVLTFEAYEELGGLKGAVAERAESVFGQLDPSVQAAFDDVMEKLVTIEPGGEEGATSRRARQADTTDTAEKEALTDALVEARLLVTGQTNAGEAVVSIAHEALLREWPRLKEWIERNRAFLQTRARVQGRAARWDEEGRPEDLLLPAGQPLAEARGLMEEREEALGSTLRKYIERSIEKAERRKRRRRQVAGGVAVAFFLVVAGFGLFSYQQWTTVAEQRNRLLRDESRELATRARAQVDSGKTMTGMLLALEALPEDMSDPDRPYVPEAQAALYHAFVHNQEQAFFSSEKTPITDATLGPEGQYLAAASEDGTGYIYDLDEGKKTAALRGHDGEISDLEFGADASRLLTSGSGTARVWKVPSGELIEKKDEPGRPVLSSSAGTDVSQSDLRFNAFASDGSVQVQDLEAPGSSREFELKSLLENFVLTEVEPEAGRVVAVGESGAQVWSLDPAPGISRLGTPQPGEVDVNTDAIVGPNGKYLARADWRGRPYLSALEEPAQERRLRGHEGSVSDFAFSPDGDRLATAGQGGIVQLWDVASGDRLTKIEHKYPVGWVGLTEGEVVTQIDTVQGTAGNRETLTSVVLWDAEGGRRIAAVDSIQGSVTSRYGSTRNVSPQILPDRSAVLLRRDPTLTEEEQDPRRSVDTDSILVQIRSTETGDPLSQFGKQRRISKVGGISPSGTHMLAEGDSLAFVFGLRNTELISTIKTGGVSSLTFSPGELRAAFLDEQHSGLVYSLEEQRVIDTLRSLAFAGPSSFSPDGRKLVGSAFNEQVKQDPLVWELSNSGAELSADLPPHGEGPTLSANVVGLETEFSPDGAYLLTMGRESKEVRLFGAKKETEGYMEKVFELRHPESVQVAHFTPDGSRVITQSEDGQVRVWPVFDSAQALIDTARAHATRQLTAKQRERFNISVEK